MFDLLVKLHDLQQVSTLAASDATPEAPAQDSFTPTAGLIIQVLRCLIRLKFCTALDNVCVILSRTTSAYFLVKDYRHTTRAQMKQILNIFRTGGRSVSAKER